MAKLTEGNIRKSLLDQLTAQNKQTDYCIDLVEMYVTHWKLAQQLKKDIKDNGIRITVQTGNGHNKEITNPSIGDLQRETGIMLQILDKMDLKTPVLAGSKDDYM